MCKTTLLLLLLVCSCSFAQATLYKYTDPEGVTHYSQTKLDDRYEAIKTPAVSIIPSHVKTEPKTASVTEEEPVAIEDLLGTFKISKPKPDENLWGTGQTVTAVVEGASELFKTYDVQYVLDGKAKPANSKATQKFSRVYRGEHKIYGQLVEKGSNRVIKKTKQVTFYIHQQTKK